MWSFALCHTNFVSGACTGTRFYQLLPGPVRNRPQSRSRPGLKAALNPYTLCLTAYTLHLRTFQILHLALEILNPEL